MKTMTYWTNAFKADRDATREELHIYQNDRETMKTVYDETRDLGPKKTVKTLIDRIGYDRAAATIATMINVIGEWDGRIDSRNRDWAKTINDAMDREAAQNYGLYCSLHSCHADQIADEMRRAERPIETVEDVEDEQTEETENDITQTVTEAAEAAQDETVEAEAEDATETTTEAQKANAGQIEEVDGETLYLERRGCEFDTDRPDGIGNYRVCTVGECIPVKDCVSKWGEGTQLYFFEFSKADKWTMRTTNKRTGAKLKKPVRELVKADALHVSTQFTPTHLSYRDGQMEKVEWADPQDYTERSILDFVNRVSTKHYSRIEYVYAFDVQVDENRNFTPRSLMHEWAKANRIPEKDGIFQTYRVELYSGLYEYGHWKISDRDTWGNRAKPGNVFVTVFLKRSAA